MKISSRQCFSWFVPTTLILVVAGCGSENQAPVSPPMEEPPSQLVGAPEPPAEGYSISVGANASGDSVDFVLRTNIPGIIDVMAGIDLKAQAPDDVYIGKTERVRIIDGLASVTIDTSELPSGDYLATVDFYPRWGFQDEVSRATGISDNLSDSHDISLGGSGESAAEMQFRENSQKWVMGNVISGYAWNESEWTERFGDFEDVPIEALNPKVISAYYFPKLDMTIFVNKLKGSISYWRVGKASR